jgi:hypothetical protein
MTCEGAVHKVAILRCLTSSKVRTRFYYAVQCHFESTEAGGFSLKFPCVLQSLKTQGISTYASYCADRVLGKERANRQCYQMGSRVVRDLGMIERKVRGMSIRQTGSNPRMIGNPVPS